MVGHVHPPFDVVHKARQANLPLASAGKSALPERRMAMVSFRVLAWRKEWMTVEEAEARRRRTLLEDNPTSG
jgi:hypothetical protein